MDLNIAPPPSKRRKQKAPTRGNIANLLGMKSVTPRSIAYVAVQVSWFCLHTTFYKATYIFLIVTIFPVKCQCME